MKKFFRTALVTVGALAAAMVGLPVPAHAQTSTSLVPDFIQRIFDGLDNPADYVTSRIRLGIIIALGVVILIAVVYSILAAIKYITSQGEEGKVADAKKAITAILSGIAALFIAIIGIVLVLVFFNIQQPPTQLYNFCIEDPEGALCQACTNGSNAGSGQCLTDCQNASSTAIDSCD